MKLCTLFYLMVFLSSGFLFYACISQEDGNTINPPMTKPLPPLENDPAYSVINLRHWYLQETAITKKWCRLKVEIINSVHSDPIDLWIDSIFIGTFNWTGDTAKIIIEPPFPVKTGTHRLIFSVTGADTGFFSSEFKYSAPYCITVTSDWEAVSIGPLFDSNLVKRRILQDKHPSLSITHFVNPHAFTSTSIPIAKKKMDVRLVETRQRCVQ